MENATIILEMLSRIQKLEKQVEELQVALENQKICSVPNVVNDNTSTMTVKTSITDGEIKRRDTTKYLFNGAVYSKNRLVLAIVKDYVVKNPVSFKELSEIFHSSLQGSIGVFERIKIAQNRQDYQIRFFTAENEIISLTDGKAYVCNQWGILNIPRFLSRAKELGYVIQEIK